MIPIVHLVIAVAILATAVVFGTDVFCAVVQRPALAHVDDDTLTAVMGSIHRYGDRRMPVAGVTGLIAVVAAAVLMAVAGRTVTAAFLVAALLALIAWLVVYVSISAPVNRQLAAAAAHHRPHPEARSLQRAWDAVIGARAVLQGIALAALCVAMAR